MYPILAASIPFLGAGLALLVLLASIASAAVDGSVEAPPLGGSAPPPVVLGLEDRRSPEESAAMRERYEAECRARQSRFIGEALEDLEAIRPRLAALGLVSLESFDERRAYELYAGIVERLPEGARVPAQLASAAKAARCAVRVWNDSKPGAASA